MRAQAPNPPAILMKEHINHLIVMMTLLCQLTGRQVVKKEIPSLLFMELWNFFVYAGSDRTYLEKYMDLHVTSRIVFSLMDP